MIQDPSKEQREHDLTVHVFTISAGLVGVCLTAIGLLRILTSHTKVATIADDLLAGDALLFTVCCSLSFWSFKTEARAFRRRLRGAIDALFMTALAVMAMVCALIAYTVL